MIKILYLCENMMRIFFKCIIWKIQSGENLNIMHKIKTLSVNMAKIK